MAAPTTLRLVDPEQPEETLSPREIDLDEGRTNVVIEDGVARIENSDGSVTFDENPDLSETEPDESDFYRNLANEIDESDLGLFASELLTGIGLDIESRKEWMETRATGIRLLGLKIEEPSGNLGPSSAPLEGMSTIRHPLLLEATIRFQATARGELLPASGPVKVRNDLPMPPEQAPQPPGAPPMPGLAPPGIGHNMPPPEGQAMDDLGAALETDMNHYLTVTATEYVPDTDRMLFYVGFGGDGFKKVYNHILKRRPVSESVDAEDIIVSNAATDIRNCGRFTHRIKMRPSMLKRMQLAGAYRDVAVGQPNIAQQINAVEREKAEVGGYKPLPMQPKDGEYEIYECYCELDIDKFAPDQFRGKQLPLPYVVTLEKESRQVLAVTRNWDEDDEQALAKQFFVQFPFIRGLGFYGLGLIHILGNVTMALTAIWRIMIDNGMFANFPGFLFAKGAGRQNSNQIRVPPGGGFPVDVPPGMAINQAFMPLPYKETGAAFTGLAAHIEEVGQRLGQTADVNIGEGKQDMPVGTTMALIEQATKIMDSVHKRLHASQAEELGLLKERFREDPEAFWRHNKRGHTPARKWTEEQFRQALDQNDLVPVADPNNPTSLHRIAKATIIDMLVTKYPQDMDKRNSLKRIMRIADIDAEGLMLTQTAPPPPDPKMVAIQAKAEAEKLKAQIEQARVMIQAQTAQANLSDKAQDRQFKERLKQFDMYLEQIKAQAQLVINAHEVEQESVRAKTEIEVEREKAAAKMQAERIKAMQNVATGQMSHQSELHKGSIDHRQQLTAAQEKHEQEMAHTRE
ncbi:MAG TPA: ATP synthase F0 subunit B, partial [Reyranella sp.]|nr:ATP synthase F0 subunit B [Reyranella sp.]